MKAPTVIGTLLCLHLAAWPTSPAFAGGEADAAAGRALASKLCERCHAIGPTGDSRLAQAPPFRTFARKWPLENLEESLAEGIAVGHKDMPEFEMNPRQISDFIAYLRTVQAR